MSLRKTSLNEDIAANIKGSYSNLNQFDQSTNYPYVAKYSSSEAIKKAEANMYAILNNADSVYALYGADLRIIAYNSLAQKFSILLYNKKLSEGAYLLDYFPLERHLNLLDVTRKVLAGEEINYEMYFDGVGQSEKWIDVKWISIKNDDNKNWGFILISKDITKNKLEAIEREKMLADLLDKNKALEQVYKYYFAQFKRAGI